MDGEDFWLTVMLFLGVVAFVALGTVVGAKMYADKPHCVQYDSTSGDCTHSMTFEELSDYWNETQP